MKFNAWKLNNGDDDDARDYDRVVKRERSNRIQRTREQAGSNPQSDVQIARRNRQAEREQLTADSMRGIA